MKKGNKMGFFDVLKNYLSNNTNSAKKADEVDDENLTDEERERRKRLRQNVINDYGKRVKNSIVNSTGGENNE